MKKEDFPKRKARSKVILDMDDIYILNFLSIGKVGLFSRGLKLDQLKDKLNMSHTSLLVHLKRLTELNLIAIRLIAPKSKNKLVFITPDGIHIKEKLAEALMISEEKKPKVLAKD